MTFCVLQYLYSSKVVVVESALKRHSFLELKIIHATQRGIVTFLIWYQEILFINLPFILKPIKEMQQHTVFPSCAKYSYITEQECHVCVTQSSKCNALQTGSWLYNLSRPRQSFKTIPAWNYPVLGLLVFSSLYFSCLEIQRWQPAGSSSTASGVYFFKFRSVQQIQ